METASFFPTSPKEALSRLYVGRSIRNVPTPAAILDVAATKSNCKRMLDACKTLNIRWRAHVKTHKTVEITRLQLGEDIQQPAQIIVSTLEEAEFLLPLFKEYRTKNRDVNILYGLPIAPGQIDRLFSIGNALGPGSISILIDHPAQLSHLSTAKSDQVVPHAYIKVNMGGDRAGVVVDSEQMSAVINAALEAHNAGRIRLTGLYSHAGHSYGGDSSTAALEMLHAEFCALRAGAARIVDMYQLAKRQDRPLPPLVLSVGASPTALSVQNILPAVGSNETLDPMVKTVNDAFSDMRTAGFLPEIHAGVYPLLDLQQLAARSLSASLLSWEDISFTVLAEVHSLYPGRGAEGISEALVGAGGLALGRESCKAYPGMAMMTPWGRPGVKMPNCSVEDYEGWMIGRFAQEHGIVTWKSSSKLRQQPDELQIGQKVRLWPNHACITGSHFGWYFVVDSSLEGEDDKDRIVDIFVRTRGW